MGLEAKASVVRRSGKDVARADSATVLWEGDAFIVRGEARIKVAREDITKVDVRAENLVVTHAAGSISVALGKELAQKWCLKMKSKPKSRLEKLGIASATRVVLIGWSDDSETVTLNDELNEIGAIVKTGPPDKDDEVVLLLVEKTTDLKRIATAASKLGDSAALWVVHPKGVADVADVKIFDAAKRADLTYTKVASFSATLTAEKLVRPRSSRTSTAAKVKVKRT